MTVFWAKSAWTSCNEEYPFSRAETTSAKEAFFSAPQTCAETGTRSSSASTT